MATHTNQPNVLRELFEALGNDPSVIAECLARPLVAERLLRSCYPFDQRIHGQLRQSATADLLAHPRVEQMRLTNGIYSEIELVRSEEGEERAAVWTEHSLKLKSSEWDETVTKIAAAFENVSAFRNGPHNATPEKNNTIPVGVVSSLQEDETRYYAAAVTEAGNGRLKVATVTWPKEPVDSWRAKRATQLPDSVAAPIAAYTLPTISGQTDGCTPDTWGSNSLNAPSPRVLPTIIWTGSEVIIWGGSNGGSPPTPTNTGGRYNPSTDTWTTMSTLNAPSARGGHTAVWTGSEMIVWGGGWLNSGGRYNPSTDSWIATSMANAPAARSNHSGVWTGTEMIVWGGRDNAGEFNTGGRYNPNTDSWAPTSNSNAPAARDYHSTVWTGQEMIVWGGSLAFDDLASGGRYNPTTDSWTATSMTNAPTARHLHSAVWTGNKMIVWGGDSSFKTGGLYDPETNTWTATDSAGAPAGRYYHTAVWSGNRMIVWGGTAGGMTNTGGRYDPTTNTWAVTSTANAPRERWLHVAVWTGTEMIIWGGTRYGRNMSTVGRYNPNTDTWAGTSPPPERTGHTAVWTGSEMIVWGGGSEDPPYDLNTGGKYTPATDTWAPTSMVSTPSPRHSHTAVWSGSEMIVWGGFGGMTAAVNTGGRYHPATDSWTATSPINAPLARSYHTAIWTGAQMIVWGGHDASGVEFNTGGKYDPNTNEWTATSTINAATARSRHTAVWTGNEMVVWAGTPDIQNLHNYINTGGRYDPGADTWKNMSTTNAPSPRSGHQVVWTGSEMIVWGGRENGSFDSPYFRSGGRYDPNADGWTATSEIDAPIARAGHTAIWTGHEMIVWGGSQDGFLNSGGRYDPSGNAWTPVAKTNNTPVELAGHTAVWTGTEMIVWGGSSRWGFMNSGGRYCGEAAPNATPSPTPTATPTPSATPSTTPTASPTPNSKLANISTRLRVETGDNVLIAGFIVQGSGNKQLIVRGIGPSLGPLGVGDALQDPTLELRDSAGGLLASNDNWPDNSNAAEIIASGLAPTNVKESALLVTITPSAYTVVLRGKDNSTGVGLVEVYDLDAGGTAKAVNISTRGFVLTGENVMIGGLIITGQDSSQLVIRAVGPSLGGLGVPNPLADPFLELHDGNGSTIFANNNWRDTQETALLNTGLAPSNNLESAILISVSPGNYTAIVKGAEGGTGNGLVEVYKLSP